MRDVNEHSWLAEVIYLLVMDVVTWVEAVAGYFRHLDVLSLVTLMFGQLHLFGSLAPCRMGQVALFFEAFASQHFFLFSYGYWISKCSFRWNSWIVLQISAVLRGCEIHSRHM
jgi:hypothetical protein